MCAGRDACNADARRAKWEPKNLNPKPSSIACASACMAAAAAFALAAALSQCFIGPYTPSGPNNKVPGSLGFGLVFTCWVVVKIMVPSWVPNTTAPII